MNYSGSNASASSIGKAARDALGCFWRNLWLAGHSPTATGCTVCPACPFMPGVSHCSSPGIKVQSWAVPSLGRSWSPEYFTKLPNLSKMGESTFNFIMLHKRMIKLLILHCIRWWLNRKMYETKYITFVLQGEKKKQVKWNGGMAVNKSTMKKSY